MRYDVLWCLKISDKWSPYSPRVAKEKQGGNKGGERRKGEDG
jgi:hypothetical protein